MLCLKREYPISLSEAFSGGSPPPFFKKKKTPLVPIIPIYEWPNAAKKGLLRVLGSQTAITCSVTLGQINYILCVMFWGQKILLAET